MYVIIYICDYVHTRSYMYKLLLCTLSLSNSCFSIHSGHITAAFAHAQWAPQLLQRTLSARLSSFHTHSECDKFFGNIRRRLRSILSMCQNRCIICSGGAAAALAQTQRPLQRPLQRLLRMLSPRQRFVTSPIFADSKHFFSKKHSFVQREIQSRKKS